MSYILFGSFFPIFSLFNFDITILLHLILTVLLHFIVLNVHYLTFFSMLYLPDLLQTFSRVDFIIFYILNSILFNIS